MTHSTDWIHQRKITANDGGDPANTAGAVEATGWEVVEIMVQDAAGDGGAAALTVAPIWWNPATETWFTVADDALVVSADGTALNTTPVRAKFLAIKVTGTDNVPEAGYLVRCRLSRDSGFSAL